MNTTEKAFKKLIKELSPIELMLLRERVMTMMDSTKEWATEQIEIERTTKQVSIIDPQLYINLTDKVNEHLSL
jgi:hypothetical protein